MNQEALSLLTLFLDFREKEHGCEWAGLAGVRRRAGVGERAQADGQAQLAEHWLLWALTAEEEWRGSGTVSCAQGRQRSLASLKWSGLSGLRVLYFNINTPW